VDGSIFAVRIAGVGARATYEHSGFRKGAQRVGEGLRANIAAETTASPAEA
jgi:hypothetical protein